MYRSTKLRETSFFTEVLRAYGKKPAVMLEKLKKKYSYEIPESVSVSHLQRLISIYSVPQEYVAAIKSTLDKEALAAFEEAGQYDETMDVHSANFDAEKAFKESSDPLYLTRSSGPRKKYDNLGKVKHLVFADHHEFKAPDRSFVDGVKARQKADRERDKAQEKNFTVFEDVMKSVLSGEGRKRGSSRSTASYGSESSTIPSASTSPFRLVNDLMREKARAEIIVRHKTGLRGVLTGYVVAADRHANLLLADVDETAAAYGKKISIRALREASRLETTPVVRRHFDQVLVRGDNIVIVSKKSA
jgi:small nuclear ribonucleoprotein (snRNP)-like protein